MTALLIACLLIYKFDLSWWWYAVAVATFVLDGYVATALSAGACKSKCWYPMNR